MSYADNPYASFGLIAAEAKPNERAGFIRQTYLHLAGAVMAFVGLEAVLQSSPLAETITRAVTGGGRGGWIVVMLAFVGVSWLADYWARSSTSKQLQYAGLALYVAAQAFIFVPLLYIASLYNQENIPIAGMLTVLIFAGLTGIVFLTGADFSFLRTALMLGGLAALGLVICGAIFGFSLGLVFVVAMIVLASGYILYDTSNVLHHYRIGQHVAAALALFASVALLFWYLVQLVMSLKGRD